MRIIAFSTARAMLAESLVPAVRFFRFLLATRREVAFAARRRLERTRPVTRRLASHLRLDAPRVFGRAWLRYSRTRPVAIVLPRAAASGRAWLPLWPLLLQRRKRPL